MAIRKKIHVLVIALMALTLVKSDLTVQVESEDEYDAKEILKLLENINTEIFDKEKLNLLNKFTIKLKQLGKENLKQLLTGNSTGVPDEQGLLEEIYFFNEELFAEIYQELVNEIHRGRGQIKLADLIQFTRNIKLTEQALHGFITIFNEMKNNNLLYNSEIFNLAHHVNDLRNMDNYQTDISDIKKRHVETLLNELPACLKNIVKATKVCIRNAGYYNEYLYAAAGANNCFLYDQYRRNVFTWIPGGKTEQGGWKLEHQGDGIYKIFNMNHREYLFAATFNWMEYRRYVFTWVPGWTDDQFPWRLELEQDYCHIKNIKFDEYLYAPIYKYDSDRRRVFTWEIKGKLETDKYFGWVTEDCSADDWV